MRSRFSKVLLFASQIFGSFHKKQSPTIDKLNLAFVAIEIPEVDEPINIFGLRSVIY
jgi:hypothetical protein